MNIKKLFAVLALVVLLAYPGFSATTTQTTLSVAVSSTGATSIKVASATGFTAGSTFAFVDSEQMEVTAVSGTTISVRRGSGSTVAGLHASGAKVYVGPSTAFVSYVLDPAGACVASAYPYLPLLNTRTGNVISCISSQWANVSGFTSLSTASSATPGTYRQIRGEVTTFSTMSSGNLVGVRGAVTVANSATISGGYLYGVQGKAVTGTGTMSGTALAGVYGQIDVTGGTLSGGNNAAVQANIYGANSSTWANLNGVYVEAAGGGVINSYMRMFGKASYAFDIETNVYTPVANTTCTPGAVTGGTGGIKVLVDGVARYIPLAATCS